MMQAIEQETYPVFYTVIGGTLVLPSGYMLSDAREHHSELLHFLFRASHKLKNLVSSAWTRFSLNWWG